jgi:protein-disulfide isomerase
MRSNWPQIADTEAFIVQYDGRNMLSRLAKIADIPQIKSVPNFVFTDYRCGFCKADRTAVTNLLKNHPGENFVFIETAILGQESVDLAEDAVSDATSQPSDYYAIHYRYFDKPSSHPTNPLSAAVALVARHRELANSLGVTSTPTYVLSGIAHVGTLGETN